MENISYDQFLTRIKEQLGFDDWYMKSIEKNGLSVTWTTGGQSGGSCWSTSEDHHYAVEGEAEPEFTELDQILEAVVPNITFLQYKVMMGSIVETGNRTSDDYYGNYTTYASKTVNLKKLYDYLSSKDLV